MSLESRLYCPEFLKSYCRPTADMLYGLYGFRHEPIPLGSVDNYATFSSMKYFEYYINSGGRLDEVVNMYVKPDKQIPPSSRFILKALDGSNATWQLADDGLTRGFYLDTIFGFALGEKEARSRIVTWLAVVGFDVTVKDAIFLPLIRQIQSGYYREKQSPSWEKSINLMDTFRWEFVLVSSVADWARGIGASEIAIMPASRNRWVHSRSLPLNRARIRYDVTARRLGGKQAAPNDPFILSIV